MITETEKTRSDREIERQRAIQRAVQISDQWYWEMYEKRIAESADTEKEQRGWIRPVDCDLIFAAINAGRLALGKSAISELPEQITSYGLVWHALGLRAGEFVSAFKGVEYAHLYSPVLAGKLAAAWGTECERKGEHMWAVALPECLWGLWEGYDRLIELRCQVAMRATEHLEDPRNEVRAA